MTYRFIIVLIFLTMASTFVNQTLGIVKWLWQ